jgi:kynurenine formamidase
MKRKRGSPPPARLAAVGLLGLALLGPAPAAGPGDPQFVDLSVLVAPEFPSTWAGGFPYPRIDFYLRIGPLGPYNSDILTLDSNTGTQLDAPPHSVPRPSTGRPQANAFGEMTVDRVPAWQLAGEACVVDVRDLLDQAPNGHSPLVKRDRIVAWERRHRPLGAGDVVLFRSDYTDRYYRPFPAGRRFIAEPLEKRAPGWPDPDPEAMAYLASRGVLAAGTDSASMGPLPDLAEPTHFAGLKHGMIWTESATGLGALPATGAFYAMLGPRHAGSMGSEIRALAITGDSLAPWLIAAARRKQVVDLSVVLAKDRPVWWPGRGVGWHRQPYLYAEFNYSPVLDGSIHLHVLDSHSGTHLVPPAYALPGPGFDDRQYGPEVRGWLAGFEKRYGRRGTSTRTVEQVALGETCGWARVIDVRSLAGTTQKAEWPASPEITAAHIREYEARTGPLRAGEVVLFRSDFSDRHCGPFPGGHACMAEPLDGASEGWPAPGPEAILYLAGKGIRCVGTDGPTLGGAEPRRALWTYWALGGKDMVAVEYLTNLSRLPARAYFLFAAPKIRDAHGGPGRAIALY